MQKGMKTNVVPQNIFRVYLYNKQQERINRATLDKENNGYRIIIN